MSSAGQAMEVRRQTCEDALGELTAMANKTMIATGSWFRRPDRGPQDLSRHIPPAHEQFQRALDRLQQEIFLAKALLEEDYNTICEEKAAAHREQYGVPVEGPPPATPAPLALPEVFDEPPQPITEVAQPVYQNLPQATAPLPIPAQTTMPVPGPMPPGTMASAMSSHLATPVPTQSVPMATTSSTEPIQPPTIVTEVAPDAPPNSVILDFPPAPDMAEAMAHSHSGISHASGSISSLLPGLESYANGGMEENMIDLLPTTNQNGQPNGQHSTQTINQNNSTTNNNNPAAENARRDTAMDDLPESNFDDLFIGSGDFGGDADDLMLNTAEMTELDDSWFQ